MIARRTILLSLVLPLFVSSLSLGQDDTPKRIESIYFDQSKVAKLYLYPGRSSLLDFPCEITRAAGSPGGDVQFVVGSTDKSELDVWLKSGASQATNLTVRCGKDVFVFDVIPSRTNHQDYLEIVGSFGGPVLRREEEQRVVELRDPYSTKKLIASSDAKLKKNTAPKKNLGEKDVRETKEKDL